MPLPAAERWLLATHDYELDADGAHVPEHPVDAAVVVCLGWRKGTNAGDPDTGHTLDQVDLGASDAMRNRDVEERQRASVRRLLDEGLIEILSVESAVGQHGVLEVVTRYRNLVTGAERRVPTSG